MNENELDYKYMLGTGGTVRMYNEEHGKGR